MWNAYLSGSLLKRDMVDRTDLRRAPLLSFLLAMLLTP